jgi:hypothetical protein
VVRKLVTNYIKSFYIWANVKHRRQCISSGGPILKTLGAGRKRPTPSSSSGNQLSDDVKKFVPSGPETGNKLHQQFLHMAHVKHRRQCIFSGGPILKTLGAGRKRPTPSSSSGNQLSDDVKKFVPSGPETGNKLHQKFLHMGQCQT